MAAFNTATGAMQATAAVRCGALHQAGAAYASNNITAGTVPLALDGGSLTVDDGATVIAVVDQVYGTASGDAVIIAPDGTAASLANGTLVAVRQSGERLLIVDSDRERGALFKT